MPPKTCGHLGCYLRPGATVGLSRTKWEVHRLTHKWYIGNDIWVFQILSLWWQINGLQHRHRSVVVLLSCRSHAASKLKLLHSGGWLGRRTVALKVQFTLFSPAPNLFTGVTLLSEQSPTGVLLPSAKVQSVRVYRAPAVWDYTVMVCQVNCDITFHLQKNKLQRHHKANHTSGFCFRLVSGVIYPSKLFWCELLNFDITPVEKLTFSWIPSSAI